MTTSNDGRTRRTDAINQVQQVRVETVTLGVRDGALTYRVRAARLRKGDHPDDHARTLATFTDPVGAVLHSTSWRFTDGHIVLTYVALPDPEPASARMLSADASLARGEDPLQPTPTLIGTEAVVIHACRHLAFLRTTDPLVAAQATTQPQLWQLIDAFRPAIAGSQHAAGRPGARVHRRPELRPPYGIRVTVLSAEMLSALSG